MASPIVCRVIVDTMRATIRRWGNSLALRIPKPFAEEAGLREDGEVEVSVEAGALRVEALKEPVWRLDELLAGVSRRNLHGAVETGTPVGREEW